MILGGEALHETVKQEEPFRNFSHGPLIAVGSPPAYLTLIAFQSLLKRLADLPAWRDKKTMVIDRLHELRLLGGGEFLQLLDVSELVPQEMRKYPHNEFDDLPLCRAVALLKRFLKTWDYHDWRKRKLGVDERL